MIRLNRQQLSQFLPNPLAIKAFENLFEVVIETLPSSIDASQYSADVAQQQAGEALAGLAAIANGLSLLLLNPAKEEIAIDIYSPVIEQKQQAEQYIPNKEEIRSEVYAALQEFLNPDNYQPPISTTDGNALLAGNSKQDFNAKQLILTSLFDISAAAAGQVKFPAVQNASADVNTLDDYEEGTFTFGFTPSTSGTITLNGSFTTGAYTKIGNMVTVTGLGFVSSVSLPVGNLQITGLPFTIRNNNNAYGACSIYAEGLAATATTTLMGKLNKGVTYLEIYKWAAGNPVANLATDVQANSIVAFTASFFV